MSSNIGRESGEEGGEQRENWPSSSVLRVDARYDLKQIRLPEPITQGFDLCGCICNSSLAQCSVICQHGGYPPIQARLSDRDLFCNRINLDYFQDIIEGAVNPRAKNHRQRRETSSQTAQRP